MSQLLIQQYLNHLADLRKVSGPRRDRASSRRRECFVACAGTALLVACAGTSHSLRLLRTGSEPERIQAIANIARSGEATPELLGALSGGLEDPSAAVRWESVGALGRLGPRAAAALPALLDCAQRQQEALALRCALVAAGAGPSALPGLRAHLASQDARLRRRSALAIAGLGTAAAPAVDDLISLLGDPDPGVSAAAKDAVIAIGTPALLPLLKAGGNRNPKFERTTGLQAAAAAAIDAMKPYPAPVLLDLLTRGGEATYWATEKIRLQGMEAEAIPVLVEFLNTGNVGNIDFAEQVLGSFGAEAASAIPALVAHLGPNSGAVTALAGIGEASLPVVEDLLRSAEEVARVTGIQILGAMRPLPLKRIVDLAHGEDVRLREEAVAILERAEALDLPALVELSRDPDQRIRSAAVLGLSRIPPWNEQAGEAISSVLLRDPLKWNRAEAARAFGRMRGAAFPATTALMAALADPDEEVGREAVAALAQIGEKALPSLLEAFRGDSASVRASALAVFGSLRKEGHVTDSVERLLRAELGRDNGSARTGAALALLVAGRSSEEEVAVAAATLRSGDPALVRMALGALREAGKAATAALPALLDMATSGGRDFAAEYLATLASVGRRDPRLVPIYIAALRRGEGGKQARAGLEWFDDDAIPPLLALLKEQDVKDRAQMELALTERGEAAVPALEAALASADRTQRRGAATLLCRVKRVPPPAVPVFLEVLQQDERDLWANALQCLKDAGAAVAPHADFLAKLYERIDGAGKKDVVAALGSCGEAARPHLPLLLAALQAPRSPGLSSSEQTNLRRSALEALGRLGHVAAVAVPVVASFAAERDGDYFMQSAATDALGMIGPPAREAIPVLLPLLDSSDGVVQQATLNALIAIETPREILAPKCLALLQSKQDRQMRTTALQYLVDSGYEDVEFPVLLERLARGGELAFEATRALRQRRHPPGGLPLNAPNLLSVKSTNWGVSVSWGPEVTGASGYRLFRREDPEGEWVLLSEVGASEYYDYGVEPGRVYAYRVEAFNADVDGRPSEVQTVAITGKAVREQHAPPTRLEVETAIVQRGDRDIRVARLSWEAPHGWDCRGFVIFRGLVGASHISPIGVSRSTSFIDEKTSPGYSETYFVRGIDAALRQSEASNEAVATAAPQTR